MGTEVDAEEPLEINDYSQATDFERLVGKLEVRLRGWCQRKEDLEEVDGAYAKGIMAGEYDGEHFLLKYYHYYTEGLSTPVVKGGCEASVVAMKHFLEPDWDFSCKATDIERWFGPHQFAVIEPAEGEDLTSTTAQSLFNALVLAAGMLTVRIPCFVWEDPDALSVNGYSSTAHCVTRYRMEVRDTIPDHCRNLEGLMDLFYLNLGLRTNVEGEGMAVATRFTYALDSYNTLEWQHLMSVTLDTMFQHRILSWGTRHDPVEILVAALQWPSAIDQGVVDNRVWSAFDPLDPPKAFLSIDVREEDDDDFRLTELVRLFADMHLEALDPDRTTFLSFRRRKKWSGFIKAALRATVAPLQTGGEKDAKVDRHMEVLRGVVSTAFERDENRRRRVRDDPVSSTSLLGRFVSGLVMAAETPADVQLTWELFVEAIEDLALSDGEHRVLPHLSGTPNLHSPLLHQKLQMLNCCATGGMPREGSECLTPAKSASESGLSARNLSTDGWDTDNLLDADDPEIDRKGAREPLKGSSLVCGDGAVYIPETQHPAPLTSDMVEDMQDRLDRLGVLQDEESALLHQDALLSDMQAFKAANPQPSVCLADFVQWHSPSDFRKPSIPTPTSDDCLSERMRIPGNLWKKLWGEAKPIPAAEQQPLFDRIKQRDDVLRWLRSLPLVDVLGSLVPYLFAAAIDSMSTDSRLPSVNPKLSAIRKKVQKLAHVDPAGIWESYKEICDEIQLVEKCMCCAASLLDRFLEFVTEADDTKVALAMIDRITANLLRGNADEEVELTAKEWKVAQRAVLPEDRCAVGDQPIRFREPTCKEFIIRCTAERPPKILSRRQQSRDPRIEPCCHRIYAAIRKGEFRLATVLSEYTF